MSRRILLSLPPLLVLAATAAAQSPGDPYRIVIAPRYHYWGYGGYDAGSGLHGAADLLRAQGQFLMDSERTRLLREDVQQKKLETRRKVLEHWAWERRFVAREWELGRQRVKEYEIRRVVEYGPPPAEIYSGAVLNTLLKTLKDNHDSLGKGDSMEVRADWLGHVHVASPAGGNAGLVKNKEVAWPLLVIGRDDLAADRADIERLLAQAKTAVLEGKRPVKYILQLRERVDSLAARLRGEIRSGAQENTSMGPAQYVAAIRQFKELKEAAVIMDQPDAGFYLSPLKGNTVAELVVYMTDNHLTFAPATWGDERAYGALYEAMRNEVKRIGAVPPLSQEP
jgi:hypothetical protein